ncbi:MAG: helix-turn-helix transcriptional regulator [Nitrospiraceae bacterium]|nr:helix-turn-helix transcriptional regulator [Nitrospiraceae bacterium]
MGEKAGISYKFIGEVERGVVNPSLDSLIGIAKALRVSVKELFPGEKDLITEFSHEELQIIKKAVSLLNSRLNVKRVKA